MAHHIVKLPETSNIYLEIWQILQQRNEKDGGVKDWDFKMAINSTTLITCRGLGWGLWLCGFVVALSKVHLLVIVLCESGSTGHLHHDHGSHVDLVHGCHLDI